LIEGVEGICRHKRNEQEQRGVLSRDSLADFSMRGGLAQADWYNFEVVTRFFRMTEPTPSQTLGADAIDVAIAKGIDFDGTPIPPAKLDLYTKVMALEAGRQRSGVSNTMRSRIVRIGAKHIPQDDLNQMLLDADFAPLKDKEIAFYYGGK